MKTIPPRGRPGPAKATLQWPELLERLTGERAPRDRHQPSQREQEAEQRSAAYRLNQALSDASRD